MQPSVERAARRQLSKSYFTSRTLPCSSKELVALMVVAWWESHAGRQAAGTTLQGWHARVEAKGAARASLRMRTCAGEREEQKGAQGEESIPPLEGSPACLSACLP